MKLTGLQHIVSLSMIISSCKCSHLVNIIFLGPQTVLIETGPMNTWELPVCKFLSSKVILHSLLKRPAPHGCLAT